MNSVTASKPTFTAPEVLKDTPYTFSLVVKDGTGDSQIDQVTYTIKNVDKAPYVKDPIKNVSVDKRSPDQIIDLKTVFADDDPSDLLSYSTPSNSDDQVVTTKITGSDLILSFSTKNIGLSEIVVAANSNGKQAQSTFKVEVKTPTGTGQVRGDRQLTIYPNPTSGKIKLVFDQIPQNGTILTVNDVTGKIILEQKIQDKEAWIDLSGNVPGVYFIKTNLKNVKVQKVILK